MSLRDLIEQENNAALAGKSIQERRGILKQLAQRSAVIGAAVTLLSAEMAPTELTALSTALSASAVALSKKATKENPILIIGQNHFETQTTLDAIPTLKEKGAKIFAMELPEDYTEALQRYLKSPRTPADRVTLTKETYLATQLKPNAVEDLRRLKETTLTALTGQTSHITTHEMVASILEDFQANPDQWSGAAKQALSMAEKAHDSGLQVLAIDEPSSQPRAGWAADKSELEANYERRNAHMVGNLKKLSPNGGIVAVVGAGHTGTGNGKSIEELARAAGLRCKSVDTDTGELSKAWQKTQDTIKAKPSQLEAKKPADAIAKNAKEIAAAFNLD